MRAFSGLVKMLTQGLAAGRNRMQPVRVHYRTPCGDAGKIADIALLLILGYVRGEAPVVPWLDQQNGIVLS